MVNIAIKWTPKDKPIKNEISNTHLSPLSFSKSLSHLNPAQKVEERKSIANAYTSVSTALNQKLSEKVNANAPIDALRIIAHEFLNSFSLKILFKIKVVDQNKNNITNALDNTDRKFTASAINSLLGANNEKIAPIIWWKGAPGGWPIWSFAEVEIYSPASQ